MSTLSRQDIAHPSYSRYATQNYPPQVSALPRTLQIGVHASRVNAVSMLGAL